MVSMKTPSYVICDARRFIDKHTWNHRASKLYSKFISEGDVAFDIGANRGNRSKVFLDIGASVVVAVEPQSRCCDDMAATFAGDARFSLHRAALGAAPGKAMIKICSSDFSSSLNPDFVAASLQGHSAEAARQGRSCPFSWDAEAEVDVITMDHLIAQHGLPDFVKLDVEGFEAQVLSGLSQPLPALSFEFSPYYPESALQSLDILESLGRYRYRISLNESFRLRPTMMTAPEARMFILCNKGSTTYGDVYATLEV